MQNVLIALGLTMFAGLATGIGSVIAFTAQRTNYRFLSAATGFSAGVMLYVSFVEIFFKGVESLVAIDPNFGCFGKIHGKPPWVDPFGGQKICGWRMEECS